ncbi:hypothetical protein [Paenibacillus sp. NPDC093718]|uniref:hypothetical protein n=1 Tax=Paenibacillus sp. NPDC093718 TaxID=3390601 RepID=UPI003D072585
MKQKQIEIYSFGRSDIQDDVISSEDLSSNKVTLSDNFLLFAWEKYTGRPLEDGQLVEEIIKVMLSTNEEMAKHVWDTGLIFNNVKYFAWFATAGGMKKENNGICETIFIREDVRAFAYEFEDLISLGKFSEIEERQNEICINKDVLSRISLAVSSCHIAGEMPNFIVLPQPKFPIKKDYKTVEKVTDDEGNVDYNLIDYHFDKDIEVFDGGAIATPNVFKQIEEELGVDYPVEFAIIRGYGLGIKGMITKFDIIGYLDTVYDGDTEYCRKSDGTYQMLDMWGDWQEVTPNTMLLNKSMVKLAKYHDGMDLYKAALGSVSPKYKDIIGKLYVTKVNKRDSDIEEYRRTNYQLVNALALSRNDYLELISPDVKSYRRILKPFIKAKEKDQDEWMINIDSIRLFFKNVANNDEESEAFQDEISRVTNNVVTKCEELLNVSEDFIKLKFVKNNLAKLIEKKCRDIASGKFTVKAKYQYIAVCPISYMNFAMHRDQGSDGLNTGEFYSGDCANGDIRTISRNPLCAYSEVHNVSFVRSERLDKWYSSCRELIYFNQKSDILALMSGADADGDACTVIDNEIIRNAVVIPQDGKYFINVDDGEVKMMQCNAENRFYATYKASGNLIGKISLKAASINSDSQRVPDYYDLQSEQFLFYRDIDAEDKKAYIQDKLESGEWLTMNQASKYHKEYIRQRFYENEKDIYTVLYNAMVSIDAPKTLYFPSSEDMKVVNRKYGRKAHFLQYKESKGNVVPSHYEYTYGLLDVFSKQIQTHLLDEIEKASLSFDDRVPLIQEKMINGDYSVEDYISCFDDITRLYESYTGRRKDANNQYLSKYRKLSNEREEELRNGRWSDFEERLHTDSINEIKQEKLERYREIDAANIMVANEIVFKYDLATIANAIGNLENCTEDFIINLFYPVFEYLNDKLKSNRCVYLKDSEGEISFLGERYKKVLVDPIDNQNIVRNIHLEDKKRLKVISVKSPIRAKVLNEDVIDFIETGLSTKGYLTFDIEIVGGKVVLCNDGEHVLQVFDDWTQIKQYNLLMCRSVKVEMLVDIALSRKSIKLTVTGIDI